MNRSLSQLGRISKTHGYNGVMVLISEHPFDDDLENLQEIFVMIDGLPVPFPVERLALWTETSARIKLEFIDSQEEAMKIVGCDVYADIKKNETEPGLDQWIGFTVHDTTHGKIGVIKQIENFKGNIVLQVAGDDDREVLISLFPELVTAIDNQGRILYIAAPAGYFG
jgi:16S rRNA processing protein RimM